MGCHCPGSHSWDLSPGRGDPRASVCPLWCPISHPCPTRESGGPAELSEDEEVLSPGSSALPADPRAAVGAASLSSPLANLIQKLLLEDPKLGPPDFPTPAQCCIHLLEGWGPDSPSAQTVLQVPRSLPTFFP